MLATKNEERFMYFPYLRGRRFELVALKELASYLAESRTVVPIIEPVNEDLKDVKNCIRALNDVEAPYAFVVNPTVGEMKGQVFKVGDDVGLMPHKGAYLAFIINRNTQVESIVDFLNDGIVCNRLLIHAADVDEVEILAKACQKSPNPTVHAFVEGDAGRSYIDSFRGLERILIRDGFKKADRNADYRERDGEFFSDLHLTYQTDGYIGFGDYATIGKRFIEGGSRPFTVAIHLTYPHPANNSLRIRHFLSDSDAHNKENVKGKSYEALTKMREFVNASNEPCTCDACTELMVMQETGSPGSLGAFKKLSMYHHITTVGGLIR